MKPENQGAGGWRVFFSKHPLPKQTGLSMDVDVESSY